MLKMSTNFPKMSRDFRETRQMQWRFPNSAAGSVLSFDAWLNDFKKTGMMRGIGWTILYHDPGTGNLWNAWVSDHEVGHLAGLPIILAMDVWEHAYAIDFLPTGRKEYIEAFFKNLNWDVIESHF